MEDTSKMLREEIGESEMPADIYVEYKGKGTMELDKKIAEAIEPLGYEMTGSGFRMDNQMRDLHFVLSSQNRRVKCKKVI
jgi:hypothetical protein